MSTPAFVEHCSELLSPLGAVRARRMFGGWGLTVDGLFMAIVFGDRLCLKVDAASQPQFERAGCAPFVYEAKGKSISLGYWAPPPEALDSPALMAPWARLALQAALSARAARVKPVRPPRAAPHAKAAARKTRKSSGAA